MISPVYMSLLLRLKALIESASISVSQKHGPVLQINQPETALIRNSKSIVDADYPFTGDDKLWLDGNHLACLQGHRKLFGRYRQLTQFKTNTMTNKFRLFKSTTRLTEGRLYNPLNLFYILRIF